MSNYFFMLMVALMGLASCTAEKTENEAEKEATPMLHVATLQNPSSSALTDALVVLSRSELPEQLQQSSAILVLQADTTEVIPAQVDDLDLDGKWDELAFLVNLEANGNKKVLLKAVEEGDLPNMPKRTAAHFGRRELETEAAMPITSLTMSAELPSFQRNQLDGPAWENDKVGYRLYLDGRNAFDVFGKRTEDMVLHQVGLSPEGTPVDNYHVLEDWGRDVLSVGNSLGAGGIALKEGEQLIRLGVKGGTPTDAVDSTSYELINSGPVRSLFRLHYHGWKVGSEKLDVASIISIQAGHHFYGNTVTVTGFEGEKTLVTGMSNRFNDTQLEIMAPNEAYQAIFTHDKQSYDDEFYVGLGFLLPQNQFLGEATAPSSGEGITETYYAQLGIRSGEPITFYFLSAWELQDERYTEAAEFEQLVQTEADYLATEVQVSFEAQ